eukprot:1721225-Pyramimonas_sp.AAC.1
MLRAWKRLGGLVHGHRQILLLNPATTPCGNLNGLMPGMRTIASTQPLLYSGTPGSQIPPPDMARGATGSAQRGHHFY